MPTARGHLDWQPADARHDLLATPVAAALGAAPGALVTAIDPDLADTAAFCAAYDVALGASANCVVVAGRRGQVTTYAAVMVLATSRADINNVVRRHLDVRKISFAPHEDAVARTGMEFGGITPLGLPEDWPILVDTGVADTAEAVIGSGLRRSKILLPGSVIAALAGAQVLDLTR
ncbi:MAG: YbaK/EbsC family protein [Actinomycetia bacterium]|nr:YbaK/EbsC family protein [Actinomycetes bacterium]